MFKIKVGALPTRLVNLIEDLRRREDRLALLLSLLIGALVGLVVVAFILLTGRLAAYMYPAGGAGWRRIAIPVVGSLVTGYLLFKFFPLARGSGIPQVRAALFVHDGRISIKSVIGKFVCTTTTLASGISLGREGPAMYIGSGLSSVIARRLGLSNDRIKSLVPVGSAAALSAAFNTPIAAVLFTLEEIVGDMHSAVLGSVVIASATAWLVLHLVLGDNPLFHVPDYHLVRYSELGIYAVLGVLGGVASVVFVKLLLWLRTLFARLPHATEWLQPVAGGLTVGILGYYAPQVMGVGYDYIERVLNGDVILKVVALLVVLKIIATAVSYSSGNSGGIFGPTLFIGAMLGGSVGAIAQLIFPNSTAGPGAYALVGMGAAFAGVVRAPLTSVIMIFEITRDYTIIVPLMVSNLIAFYISQRLQKEQIYTALALQDGLHLPGTSPRRMGTLRVMDADTKAPESLRPETLMRDAADRVSNGNLTSWPVADDDGLVGMVRVRHIETAMEKGKTEMTIGRLMEIARRRDGARSAEIPHIHKDHTLSQALARMGDTGHKVLPVVSRANARIMLGIVTLQDILDVYGVEDADELDYAEHPDL